jgi:hypothetical protein
MSPPSALHFVWNRNGQDWPRLDRDFTAARSVRAFWSRGHATPSWIGSASVIAPLLVGIVSFCHAGQSVTLAWDRNAEQDIANYRLYYGTQSGKPSQSLSVGNVTTATITNLDDGTTYFFGVAAVNTGGQESPPSNEVSYTTPNPAAYVLTVNSGSGTGSYVAGTIVTVSANAPPAGTQFDRWLDDWVILSNPWMATTTATMPYQHVTITPSYSDLPAGGKQQ